MKCINDFVPRELGYRMPGEWEPRKRTFMQWPVRTGENSTTPLWPEGVEAARKGYAAVAQAIAEFGEVVMITSQECYAETVEMCGPNVKVLCLPIDDSWARDNGPTFVINDEQELAMVKWRFSSYGEKYQTHYNDGKIPQHLSVIYDVPMFKSPLCIEGGGIHTDGQGTALTTATVLFNMMRNSRYTHEECVELLKQYLNVEDVIVFPSGLYGDLTDGHVDNVACFVRPGVIVIQACYDPEDPDYEIYQANRKVIDNFRDRATGLPFEVYEIEKPPRRYYNGQLLTMSYINYLPVPPNGVVVPTFGGDAAETDRKALETLQKLYPNHKIRPIDGMPIIIGGGCVHCITQQMPLGKSL